MMTKEVYIRFKDGEKESELKLESINSEHQLALMDGVFKFFNLDVDFKELATIYHRSGKAYQEFFEKMDANTDYKEELTEPKVNTEQYATALKETVIETEKAKVVEHKTINGYHPSYDLKNTDYFTTGIKYDSLGKPLYKCRYKCPQCNDESNHYVKTATQHVRCWKCQRMLKVQPATVHGEPEKANNPEIYRDTNGNFYVAGSFEIEIKTLADIEKEGLDLE